LKKGLTFLPLKKGLTFALLKKGLTFPLPKKGLTFPPLKKWGRGDLLRLLNAMQEQIPLDPGEAVRAACGS
jgi:hypothetical protein